ncbi:MAG: hypothetical protein Q9227_006500 [Pyrenula ochraceoflavens]
MAGPGSRPYPHQSGPMRPGYGPPSGRGPPMQPRGRPSFDRADDRQPFPSHQAGFEGPYPTAQRPPFGPPPDHMRHSPAPDPRMGRPRQGSQPRPIGYDAYPHAPFMPDPRAGPYPPPSRTGRRSESGHRPSPSELYGRRESPGRPMPHPMHSNRTSRDTSPSSRFPPRKSSLGQQQAPIDPLPQGPQLSSTELSEESGNEPAPKPLPFIRPADIYKRMEEEKEKQRRQSQDSARPSVDSLRTGSVPTPPPPLPSGPGDSSDVSHSRHEQIDSKGSMAGSKPVLNTFTGRKSIHESENVPEDHSSATRASTTESTPVAEPASATSEQGRTYASSQYSDRPDPVSATSAKSKESFIRGLPETFHVSDKQDSAGEDQRTPRAADGFQSSDRQAAPSGLGHTTSMGYRSLVNQAFEDSENRGPPTPSSNNDSVLRSGSTSTSDISPILSRNSSSAAQQSAVGGQRDAPPTIPEEPANSGSRPTSSDISKPAEFEDDEKPLTPPPAVRQGYRRSTSTPSPNNSPARRPVSAETGDVPHSELATLDTISPQPTRTEEKSLSDRATASDEYQSQASSTRQAESLAETHHEGAIPRSESPTKGKVRDLAGRFNESGASSPSASPQKPSPRPHNARLDSFRPALPGSWASYTTNSGFSTPQVDLDNASTGHRDASNVESQDQPASSVTPGETGSSDLSKNAFAAAAAAGSALAGAFTSIPGVRGQAASESDGDAQSSHPESFSKASSLAPSPLPKDTPRETATDSSRMGYFAPPLDTTVSKKESTPLRPHLLPTISTDLSPDDSESDRLRKEILKDLTPHSTKEENDMKQHEAQLASHLNTPTRREEVESTLIPKEYDNYWGDINQSPDLALKDPNAAVGRQDQRSNTKDLPPVPQPGDKAAPPRQIKKRFSWESSSSGENYEVPVVAPLTPHSPQQPRQQLPASPEKVRTPDAQREDAPYHEGDTRPLQSYEGADSQIDQRQSETNAFNSSTISDPPPALMLSEPTTVAQKDAFVEVPLDRDAVPPETPQKDPFDSTPSTSKPSPGYRRQSNDGTMPKALSYREISAMKSPQKRIAAYNAGRDEIAQIDSGLNNWLQSTSQMLPEHADVISRNGRLSQEQAAHLGHKLSPSRSKFPRIASLTGAVQPSQGATASTSSGSEPVGGGIQQMQEDGKKLLQSAGKLGGKAGGAAKGLLLKGKSKFRQSGGGEKVSSQKDQAPPIPSIPRGTLDTERLQEPQTVVTSALGDLDQSSRTQKAFDEISALGSQDGNAVPSRTVSEVTQPKVSGEQSRGQEHPSGSEKLTEPMNAAEPTRENTNLKAEVHHDGVSLGTNSEGGDAATLGMELQDKAKHPNVSDISVNVEQRGQAMIASKAQSPAIVNIAPRTGSGQFSADTSVRPKDVIDQNPKTPYKDEEILSRDRGFSPAPETATMIGSPALVQDSGNLSQPEPIRDADRKPANFNEGVMHSEERPIISTENGSVTVEKDGNFPNDAHQIRDPKASFAMQSGATISQQRGSIDENKRFPPRRDSLPVQSRDGFVNDVAAKPSENEVADPKPQTEMMSGRRQRQSYSRPFKGPDVNMHPAYRGDAETVERRSQVYASEDPPQESFYEPSYRSTYESDQPQDESVFRIPGPYGQQFRSPRQPAFPPNQFSPTGPEMGTQRPVAADIQRTQRFDANGNLITYTQYSGSRPRSQDRSFIRPISTEYEIPGVGPPPPEPTQPKERPRSGIFSRARSRSRPRPADDDASDTVENLFREDQRRERRSSIFSKRSSKQKSVSNGAPQESSVQVPRKSSTLPAEQLENGRKSKKLQRASTSGVPQNETKRKSGFSRWSGIFSRSKSTNKSSPPLQATVVQSPSRIEDRGYHATYQPARQMSPTLPDLTQMQAATLPPPKQGQGYYAVYSSNPPQYDSNRRPSSPAGGYYAQQERYSRSGAPGFVGGRQLSEQQVGESKHNFESDTGFRGPYHSQPGPKRSPPNLRINTESSKHRSVPSQSSSYKQEGLNNTAPPAGPSRHSPYAATSPTHASPYGYGSARGLKSTSLSHAINLQKRSRSPREGRRNSEDEGTRNDDPAHNLGTFSNRSSRQIGNGEQELPWRIDLPQGEQNGVEQQNDETRGHSWNSARNSTNFQRMDSIGNHGHIASQQKATERAELQGSRVPGDESEEDIVMTSTAYPGQEWIPSRYGWDD